MSGCSHDAFRCDCENMLKQELIERRRQIAALEARLKAQEAVMVAAMAYAEEVQEDCQCVNQVALDNFNKALDALDNSREGK